MRRHSFAAGFLCALAVACLALIAALDSPERAPRIEQTQTVVVETRRVTTQPPTHPAQRPSPIVPAELRSTRGLLPEPVLREPEIASETQYVGNVSSLKFHDLSCVHAGCPNCTVRFASQSEARRRGFRPGGCCNP